MNAAVMTLSQMRYVNKAFWRNPASAFFTFAFPLMFLVIFTSLLGHNTVHIGTRLVNLSTYYVAAMAAFAVISACYTNIATAVTFQRDAGVLKRLNGTPLPAGPTWAPGFCMRCWSRSCWSRSPPPSAARSTARTSRPARPCSGSW
jgi:ABC-2 type transport system permease protein